MKKRKLLAKTSSDVGPLSSHAHSGATTADQTPSHGESRAGEDDEIAGMEQGEPEDQVADGVDATYTAMMLNV